MHVREHGPGVLERNLLAPPPKLVFELRLSVAPADPAPIPKLLGGGLQELVLVHFIIISLIRLSVIILRDKNEFIFT